MKKIPESTSILLFALLLWTANFTAYAETFLNIGNGNVTIDSDGTYTITGSSGTNTIKVNAGVTAYITLDGVDIDVNNQPKCAFDMAGATVYLTLVDDNTLKSGGNYAGLSVPSGATLEITKASTGSLTAFGNDQAAGIGGGRNEEGGNITINGGNITATNNAWGGAGIGGGREKAGGVITINGGTINAYPGGSAGAGIGGGHGGAGGVITINGGVITASTVPSGDKGLGAAIGGGGNGTSGGAGGTIIITGGTITATRGVYSNIGDIGPGIGGAAGTITITGGSLKCTTAMPTLPIPQNADGTSVYLATLTLTGAGNDAGVVASQITNGKPYGVQDVVTLDEGKIYAWLPSTTKASQIKLYTETDLYALEAETEVGTANNAAFSLATSGAPADMAEGSVRLQTNGASWTNHNRQITVSSNDGKSTTLSKQDDGTYSVTGIAGTYSIYDNNKDTGATLTLPGTATLNYQQMQKEDYTLAATPSLTYTGTAQGPTITNSNNVNTIYTNAQGINAGTYTVTARVEDQWVNGTNYAMEEVTIGSYTITKAELEITGFEEADGKITSLTFSGLQNGETLNINTDYLVTGYALDDTHQLTSLELTPLSEAWQNYQPTNATLIPTIDMSNTTPQSYPPYWTYVNDAYRIQDGANVMVTGNNSGSQRSILIEGGAKAKVTLYNASITASSPLAVSDNADLSLYLVGINTLTGGLQVTSAKLTIDGTGSLTAIATDENGAGIGGAGDNNKIIIYGGNITANGGSNGAGIGGRKNSSGGTIIIYGGDITTQGGGNGAGIGSGDDSKGGTITIYGGTITAKGGKNGAGIGTGLGAAGATITIYGGTITASSSEGGAGIGGSGWGGTGGTITIHGGTITATKGKKSDKGDIGPGGGDMKNGVNIITITGGSIHCTSDTKIVGTLTNGSNQPVYLATLTVGETTQADTKIEDAVISTAPTYGLNDVTTDSNGCLYFWLPASAETTATAATVLANNQAYKNSSITVADDNTTTAILTLDANIQTHSVTYNANEAGGTAPIDSKKYLPNSPVTLPDKGDLEKTGYAFCGWTRLGNNDNAILQPGDQFFMPSEDVTLTAVWKLKTVSVDKSATAASEGLADQISFSLTTENITDGTYPVTVNSATNGVTADNVTISDNHGTLMLRTTADTPNGEHQLSVTIDGITSNDFNLNVLAKVTASYLDQDGNTQTKDGVIQLTSPGNKTLSKDEWYLLCGEVSGDFLLTVSNQAHLILKDNSCWTINKGIRVNAPNALSIYAQSTGEAMGKLIATPENKYNYDSSAAIGGNAQNTGGKITIYGGNITATGSQHGAAIGGGIYGAGGTITIYGGNITAITFQDNYMTGAAIGGGNLGNGGTITIHGGNITATSYSFGAAIGGGQDGDGGTITIYGGNIQALSNASYYATGIGGGRNASGGTITIYGGNITAIGGYEAAAIGGGGEDQSDIKSINVGTISIHGGIIKATGGKNKGTAARFAAVIGGGYGCDDGSILITGGTITATKGGNSQGYDIGHGCNTTNTKGPTQITITGGSIHCTSDNKIDGTLTNGSDQPVYLSTLTVGVAPIVANTAVTESNIGYGLTDVVTDADGKLYFWLPVTGDNGAAAERISLTANDAAYANTFVRGAVNTTSATLLPPQSPPQAEIDYVAERLTQLDNNATYLFNNTTDAADNGYPIAPEWIGETLTIVKKGDNTSTSDSEPQSLPIPARPAAPTTIKGIAETIDDYNNGRIEGVNETMEYQKAGDNDSWTPCTSTNGGSIENLAPDTYHIRYKATSEAFASEPATIVIANGAAQTRVLNITLPTFDPLTYGYGELPEAQAITIKNSGNTPATITKIAVSNPELFTLGGSDAMVEVVEADAEIATWTIQPALNLNAGTYSASITVTYNGTSGETATETQSFTVEKKAPEVEDLDFTLKNATYNGVAHGVTVSWKSPRTNPGGALTVKYNGSTIQPIDPGAYAVTVEVNAAGTNFLATNKPLALGTFRIFSPTEPLLCSVTIPVIPGAKTTPIAGIYHLSAGYDFEFLIHPNAEVDASAMTVTTGRPNDDRGGVVVTPRTDGSYYVRIVAVNERITVSVQLPIPTDLASPKGENLRIWTSASQLHLSAGAEAVHAKVFTPAGLLVKTLKAAPGETVATTLAPGLYFVATNKGDPHKIVISGF